MWTSPNKFADFGGLALDSMSFGQIVTAMILLDCLGADVPGIDMSTKALSCFRNIWANGCSL